MNDIKHILMKKSGVALSYLAGRLLRIDIGEKIPTFTELYEKSRISRGTLQNAMKKLQELRAIAVEARGHMGTYLVEKDLHLLLQLAGIECLAGVMPLPYTRVYEGMATALITTIKEISGHSIDLSYMRGSQKRINGVMSGRYDFAVVSRMSAITAIAGGKEIEIIKDFGSQSYLKGHVIVLKDKNAVGITDNMRVGRDNDSVDQVRLTNAVIEGKRVEIVPINYSQAMSSIIRGEIDAAVWNLDQILERYPETNYKLITMENNDDNTAVIVIKKKNLQIKSALEEFIDIKRVLKIQDEVVKGKLSPSY